MLVEGFPAQLAGTNCWVVAPGRGQHCVVIDPGVGIGPMLDEVLARHDLKPAAVLLTHGHLDHTFSVLPVCQAKDVPAYIAQADRAQLADPWSGMGARPGSALFGIEGLTFAEPDDVREIADGDALALAGLSMVVRATPGHTPGSVTFELPDANPDDGAAIVFAGDTLFAGSIGRMDLVGGSTADMARSLASVYLPMPDATVIHPGHGPSTTMGRERRTNPYLRQVQAGMTL